MEIDRRDISRINLFKINQYIKELNSQLKDPSIDVIIKEELNSELIKAIDARDFIQDMRYEKST